MKSRKVMRPNLSCAVVVVVITARSNGSRSVGSVGMLMLLLMLLTMMLLLILLLLLSLTLTSTHTRRGCRKTRETAGGLTAPRARFVIVHEMGHFTRRQEPLAR
jgi:Zn-dependent protease with chaperone function